MKIEKVVGLFLIGMGFVGLWILKDSTPIVRLALASIGMIWLIKWAALLWQSAENGKPHSPLATTLFLFVWPGVSLAGFTEPRREPPSVTGARFLESWLCFLVGIMILVFVSLIGEGKSTPLNYAALFAILLIIHLGFVEILADGLRLLGFSPPSLFDRPILAASLRDFWSNRWNRAFVDMNKIFLLHPFRSKVPGALLVFSIFVVSGLLHELGISYSDGTSWGRPMLYFVLQGLGMEVEKRVKFPRLFVWLWILVPVPLLFTPDFVNLFLGGLTNWISDTLRNISREDFLRYGLLAGGFGHLLVLCASVQVPGKLGWKQEFQKLAPLNRKIFWTYGGYIFSIIVFMAAVSFILAQNDGELPSVAAKLWLAFIALFWWARVLTDFFYMEHSDWPKGAIFVIGHTCLTTLFVSLALGYSALMILSP